MILDIILGNAVSHTLFAFLVSLAIVLSVFALVIAGIIEYHIYRYSNIAQERKKRKA